MTDPCESFITDPFVFPRRPENRPALDRIAYRIGAYPEFREAILRYLDRSLTLAAWTHRQADDPGIALLEGAALLGDILTFYQEHYANEAFLRTACWRESVADLVRLLGYRLAPGLGGRATFAFLTKGTASVTIPAGFPLKVELADIPKPAEFQTEAELVAYPHLGKFHLYRERQDGKTIPDTKNPMSIEIAMIAGQSEPAAFATLDLKKGDRLLIVPSEAVWSTPGTPYSVQKTPQVVTVAKLNYRLGRAIIEIDSSLVQNWTAPITAYRVGRSFHHFGYNAPPQVTETTSDSSTGRINGAKQRNAIFRRHFSWECTDSDCSIALPSALMPLDVEVTDLTAGRSLLIEARVQWSGHANLETLLVKKRIDNLRSTTIGWGNLNGVSSLLTLDSELVTNTAFSGIEGDIRDLRLYEITSLELSLRPPPTFPEGSFANGKNALYFYGTAAEAQALAGRRLWFEHSDGRTAALVCTNLASDFVVAADQADTPKMWPLSFDRAPAPFLQQDFDELAPSVTVYGNLIDATEGKAEREAVLGNGDSRQVFQTFPLPKAPLTYLLSAGVTPPQVPELEVYVNGRLWSRVPSFFGHDPGEEIYIVREDAEGRSYVQFGDGETGARLPSGLKNVTGRYRTGSGAHGPLKPGAVPSSGRRIEGLDKLHLAGEVAGGTEPEAADKAREAAPGKVQSLGRLVSLRDFETEVLGIPGVVTAMAAWDLHDGVPALLLRVLLEAGREAEFNDVRATIARYQRCRGPDRFPVIVEPASLRYVFLDLSYAFDPRRRREDVEAALRAALGLARDESSARQGLFGLWHRRLGEREYASRIEGYLQNVAGVLWCRVTALGQFAASVVEPASEPLPPVPRAYSAQLACGAHELLQLHPNHITLTPAAVPSAGECA